MAEEKDKVLDRNDEKSWKAANGDKHVPSPDAAISANRKAASGYQVMKDFTNVNKSRWMCYTTARKRTRAAMPASRLALFAIIKKLVSGRQNAKETRWENKHLDVRAGLCMPAVNHSRCAGVC